MAIRDQYRGFELPPIDKTTGSLNTSWRRVFLRGTDFHSIFGWGRLRKFLILPFGWIMLSSLVAVLPAASQTQHTKPAAPEPTPEPAIPAILAAFDRYEVVAMPEAHGMKDVDDFILALIRNPSFPGKVNDIEVDCGNSLYQPVLDRYIAGEDVPFTEVGRVWRNTTQSMCGYSGFFEQFFPLVRAINQKLPTTKRLRVLAGDPPVDWEKVKTSEEGNFSIADLVSFP